MTFDTSAASAHNGRVLTEGMTSMSHGMRGMLSVGNLDNCLAYVGRILATAIRMHANVDRLDMHPLSLAARREAVG